MKSRASGVSILTDMAVAADKIDEAKVEEARQRAEARLREKISAEEVASVNASLARSLAQLHVKRRRPDPGTEAICPQREPQQKREDLRRGPGHPARRCFFKALAVQTKEEREIAEQTVATLLRTRERERKGSMNRRT